MPPFTGFRLAFGITLPVDRLLWRTIQNTIHLSRLNPPSESVQSAPACISLMPRRATVFDPSLLCEDFISCISSSGPRWSRWFKRPIPSLAASTQSPSQFRLPAQSDPAHPSAERTLRTLQRPIHLHFIGCFHLGDCSAASLQVHGSPSKQRHHFSRLVSEPHRLCNCSGQTHHSAQDAQVATRKSPVTGSSH